MKYKAFISYSHAEDGKLAPALQTGLHKFNRPWYRLRAIRVFRDDTNLALSPGLWSSIQQALEASEYFLLLASPQGSGSKWVKREVDFWLEHSSAEKLLIVLTDGEIDWDSKTQNFNWSKTNALPKNLDGVFSEEPLFLDMRTNKTKEKLSLDHPEFLDKIATVGAKLYGRPKNDLIGDDVTQHKKVRRIAWTVGVALVVLTISSIMAAVVAVQQRKVAEKKAMESQSLALTANAQKAHIRSDRDLAIALSMEANKILEDSKIDHDSTVLAEVKDAFNKVAYLSPGTRRVYKGHRGKVTSVAISPKSKRYGMSGSEDTTLRIWDLKNGNELQQLTGHSGEVTSIAYSPNGDQALSGSTDKAVRLWDIKTGKVIQTFLGHTKSVKSVAFGPKGHFVLSGGDDGSLRLWDVATRREFKLVSDNSESIVSVAFSPNGTRALSGSKESTVCLWDLVNLKLIQCRKEQGYSIHSVAFSPAGGSALSGAGGWDRGVIYWDIGETLSPLRIFDRQEGGMLSLVYHPDSLTALSGATNNKIFLWDVSDRSKPTFGKVVDRFLGHSGAVTSIAFSPDGQTFLSGSEDKTLRLWQMSSDVEVRKWEKFQPESMGLSPSGRTVFVAGNGRRDLLELDIHTGAQINRFSFPLGEELIFSIAINPNGQTALLGSGNGQVYRLDLKEKQTKRLPGIHNGGRMNDIVFSPDGSKALSASYGQQENEYLLLWNMKTEKVEKRLVGHTEVVRNVAISPDGHLGLSGSADGAAILWDLEKGTEIRRFVGHVGDVLDVAFRDEKSVVTASKDGSLRLWAIETGKTMRIFNGHIGPVGTISVSPSGDTMSSAGEGKAIRFWKLDTGENILTFRGHAGPIVDTTYTQDGNHILSLSWDKSLRLWQIELPGNLIEWTHANRYVRELSCEERKLYRIVEAC